jgi:cytidylate kinase
MATPLPFLNRLSESIEHSEHHWSTQRRMPATRVTYTPTIAITRQAGTPGTSLAREIGKRLEWQVYDHELVEQIARDMGARTSLLETVDERDQNWLLDSLRAFGSSSRAVTESSYVRHLVETVLALGARGNCVIVGRGAGFILPGSTTLRVRLIAPQEERIAAVCRDRNWTRHQAAAWVEQTDRERRHFVRNHFVNDPEDPNNYDLLVNMAHWTIAEAADIVLRALRVRELHEANASLTEIGS